MTFLITICVYIEIERVGISPGKSDQMRVFIEIHRVSVTGLARAQETLTSLRVVTAGVFTLPAKQTGKGWRTKVLCRSTTVQLCIYCWMQSLI